MHLLSWAITSSFTGCDDYIPYISVCNLRICLCKISLQSCSLGIHTYIHTQEMNWIKNSLFIQCWHLATPCKLWANANVHCVSWWICVHQASFAPGWRVIRSEGNWQNNGGWRLNEKGVQYSVLLSSGRQVRGHHAVSSDCAELNSHGEWTHTINGRAKRDYWDCIYNWS